MRAIDDKIAPKAAGLADVDEGWVEDGFPVDGEVREGSRARRGAAMILLPFVEVMSGG